ncbi:MAG: alpha-glucan family phosphorylase [Gammaproteobacteria bacterium]|nr:alpha-glucan family phosphorylase [Gammaproteobacteria bacterium]
MPGKEFKLEVNPRVPEQLARLPELADDLWYSWNRPARSLFRLLNPKLWRRTGHNPKLFLRSVDESTLLEAAHNPVFLAKYHQAISAYDSYMSSGARCQSGPEYGPEDLVAYFCAEYGIHESMPIYSGGLGILAGDHCKTASDMRMPFVGVGLLYRQGYFSQHIDAEGTQHAIYRDNDLEDLAVRPALDGEGREILVAVDMPGREVDIKVWQCQVGHVTIYLLDTNLDTNSPEDREITHKLYGGGKGTRMRQEIVLGIGGVRALRALGIKPSVWHCNEGHAAFMPLERIRELVASGVPYATGTELVAAKTVFTTHTPVPAGHDVFPHELVVNYFEGYAGELGISVEQLFELGRNGDQGDVFNMTTLATTLSKRQNGVSQIHGKVSSEICHNSWSDIPPHENPISYVTNGVHLPSFLAQPWIDMFDRFLGAAWRNHLTDTHYWQRLDEIPDHLFWSTSQSIKSQMFYALRGALSYQSQRNQVSEAHLERLTRYIKPREPNFLTIGFARRFATYKRAPLFMNNLEVLREIVTNEERPVIFVFAGKAHPADHPGQELLRQINNLASDPDFVGRVLMVEGYDLALARRLVSGVDVWLNNPVYPLEASGTSGMKAAINGSLNLSVLDGWWAEGFDGANGWGIKPSPHDDDEHRRDYEDARTLYEILQDDVVPTYYDRNKHGYSPDWVKRCKRSMMSIIPRFNTCRMLAEYGRKFYLPASEQGRILTADNHRAAGLLADWKARVRAAWPTVRFTAISDYPQRVAFGDSAVMEVEMKLDGLEATDVAVELLLTREGAFESTFIAAGIMDGEGSLEKQLVQSEGDTITVALRFVPVKGQAKGGVHRYRIDLQPDWCGKMTYRIRAFPYHELLAHPHEMGLMKWMEEEGE